jgi:hypothetical protein
MNEVLTKNIRHIKCFAIRMIVLFFLFVLTGVYANEGGDNPKSLTYYVVKNDNIIGTINVSIDAFGDSTIYVLEGAVKTKYLMTFDVSSREKSIYNKGMLVYSSIYRTMNKKIKANHSIRFNGGQYDLKTANKLQVLNCDRIRSNLITLFFKEPLNVKKIYADNSRKFVDVTSLGDGRYKVQFSGGKYNIFHYKNGKCIKIEATSSLFNVTLLKA